MRPTIYSEELADKICDLIVESNSGLSTICKLDGMPARSTVHRWMEEDKIFKDKYARAKEDQADRLAEEIISIADNDSDDLAGISDTGKPIANNEFINRSRLKVDARKWVASKLKPKTWGDKTDVTTNGKDVGINYEDFIKNIKNA